VPVSTETAEVFFTLLAVVAAVTTVALIVCRLLASRSAGAQAVVDLFSGPALALAAVVAATCMAGSLYFSEVADFVPCTLCWYQRIAMYPLVVILAIAAWRRDRDVWHYVVPLAGVGAVISTYHYIVEWFPEADSGVCKSTVPCTFVWFRQLGFVSLPLMALCGFALIITLVTLPQEDA
jgi:disulfide bond formation protein DsbB